MSTAENTPTTLPPEREAAKARVRAKVAASKAMPARERIYHLLCATHTHAEAEAMLAELEAAPRTVYRASHDSIVMDLYTTAQAAMDHVHATLANEEGCDVTARVIWRADDPEDDEPTWECWLFDADMADDSPTGYVVTPLTVASHYDEEADE